MKDDDSNILERLLLYLYILDYDDGVNAKELPPTTVFVNDTINNAGIMQLPNGDEANSNRPMEAEDVSKTVSCEKNKEVIQPTVGTSSTTGSHKLIVNTQVYAMAEKFDIPQLKLLAKEKFLKNAQSWPNSEFPAIAHEVLTSTPQSDRGLRDILRDMFTSKVVELTVRSEDEGDQEAENCHRLLSVLSGEGEFVVEVLGIIAKQMDSHRKEAKQFQEQVKEIETEKDRHQSAYNEAVERGACLVSAMTRLDKCPECEDPWQPVLVNLPTRPDDSKYWLLADFIKCRSCYTRYQLRP